MCIIMRWSEISLPSSQTAKEVSPVQSIGVIGVMVGPEPTHVNVVAHLDAKVTSPDTTASAMTKPPTSQQTSLLLTIVLVEGNSDVEETLQDTDTSAVHQFDSSDSPPVILSRVVSLKDTPVINGWVAPRSKVQSVRCPAQKGPNIIFNRN